MSGSIWPTGKEIRGCSAAVGNEFEVLPALLLLKAEPASLGCSG